VVGVGVKRWLGNGCCVWRNGCCMCGETVAVCGEAAGAAEDDCG
jgi:hypothetical protein